jgi:hypothetical protein
VKRVLRWCAGIFILGYLGIGAWLYGRAASPKEAELPTASWAVSRIEAHNREALHVLATTRAVPAVPPERASAARFLPDLKPLEPYDIYTIGSRREGTLRLKFATMIYNGGRGPLETRGARNPDTGKLEVYQYVYEGARATRGRWIGTFDYDHRHGHLHFANFAHYELWSLDASGRLLEPLVDNAKVGFCLMDIRDMASGKTHLESGLVGTPEGPVYAGCREDVQGISVGWGDEYVSLLYEQDLDLSGIPGGRYALVITSNPDRQIEELDYRNNRAVVYLTLEGEKVAQVPRPRSGG